VKLRIAYIGAGNFSTGFLFPQLARHDVDCAAVCDLDERKAAAAQERFGFERRYTDFRRMLDEVKPDAVFCVGGPAVHHAVGMEVLDRGFPLYVQKSPAPGAAATRVMAELAARRRVVCHVGFNLRFSIAGMRAKAIIGSAEFGAPLLGVFRYGLAIGSTMRDVVMDQHCHLVDLARFLLGDIETIHAIPSGYPGAREYVATVRFQSGAVGTLNFASGQVPEKDFISFEVTGPGTLLYTRGTLASLSWQRNVSGPWWKSPCADEVYELGSWGFDRLEVLGYIGDMENFLSSVGGARDLSPIESTVGTMEACEELLRQVAPALS
jgi:myo-inositol 2-dehydrogenase / D-chiro-inositol 1-dehydrogenase